MTSKIIERSPDAIRDLIEQAEILDGARITVGVHEDSGDAPHPSSGGTVANVAATIEFGSATQAPLAPLRSAIDARDVTGELRDAAAEVLSGHSTEVAFADFAEDLVDAIREGMPNITGTTRAAVEARIGEGRIA